MDNKKEFFFKSKIITTIIIFLTYVITISILFAISKNISKDNPTGLILIISFSVAFGLLILYFWIREIIKFQKAKHEK